MITHAIRFLSGFKTGGLQIEGDPYHTDDGNNTDKIDVSIRKDSC